MKTKEKIVTGVNALGLRWARLGNYRILAHADGIGYSRNVLRKGVWYLYPRDQDMPAGVKAALLNALDRKVTS